MAPISSLLPLPDTAFNRRVAVKAAASFAAMAALGPIRNARPAAADGTTSALTWLEADHPEATPDANGWTTFSLETTFSAFAPTWDAAGGTDPIVQIQVSS